MILNYSEKTNALLAAVLHMVDLSSFYELHLHSIFHIDKFASFYRS